MYATALFLNPKKCFFAMSVFVVAQMHSMPVFDFILMKCLFVAGWRSS